MPDNSVYHIFDLKGVFLICSISIIIWIYCISIGFIKVTDAKKKSDEDQAQLDEAMATKKKQDKELEALQERIDELQLENGKLIKSKKRLQEEVCALL